ncbi:unnamed protein product [Cladocopium goreaui]|uniref:Uncharacterized protein n=1 Tax=Cladocopium goreaui TaxID=2562237 RepID=A0A9P1D1A0_9DINO|nr:unnamed protein product [Cladocopium goreaui]
MAATPGPVPVAPLGLLDLPFAAWNVEGLRNFSWRPRRPLQYLSQTGKELLDCRTDKELGNFAPGWSYFLDSVVVADRRFGIERVKGCGGNCLRTARQLQFMAAGNTEGWRAEVEKYLKIDTPESRTHMERDLILILWKLTRIFQQAICFEIPWETAKLDIGGLCPFGLLFVSHYWPDFLPSLGQTKLWQRTLLGHEYAGDFLASSSWPLNLWDVIMEMNDSTNFKTVRGMLSSHRGGADLVRAPLLRTSIDPQGLSCVARFEGLPTPHCRMARGRLNLEGPRLAVSMGHVSLTVEIATVLMKAVPESNVTMLCTWDEKAEGRPKLIRSLGDDEVTQKSVSDAREAQEHMFSCSKMCSLSAGFCSSPRVGFQWQPDKKEWVGNQADVLVCFDYWTCVQMGARHQKPLLIYDGMQYGAELTGYPDPDWLSLPYLRELVEHDVYVRERVQSQALKPYEVYSQEAPNLPPELRLPANLRTLLVTNDPWNAESIFFRTGLRVPSARVVSYYLSCRYDAGSLRSQSVFVLNCRGRCGACQGFWFLVWMLTPDNYPLNFYRTDDYVDYCSLAKDFRALIMVPHGNVMQMMYFEGTNMALPVLLPDLRLMSRLPFLWWSERMTQSCDEECKMKFRNPPKPEAFQRPHPFPFLVTTLRLGRGGDELPDLVDPTQSAHLVVRKKYAWRSNTGRFWQMQNCGYLKSDFFYTQS